MIVILGPDIITDSSQVMTGTPRTRRNISIGIPLNLSMSGKWNEVPEWSGVTLAEDFRKIYGKVRTQTKHNIF